MDLLSLAQAVSFVFLTLVKSLLAPLLFGLVVSSLGAQRGPIGRLGWISVFYFEIVTGLAMWIGWASMAYFRPGTSVPLPASAGPATDGAFSVSELLVRSVPASGFEAMARNDVLPMIFFFGLLGLAARRPAGRPLVDFAESVYAISQQYARYIMWLAIPGMIAALSSGLLSGGWSLVAGMGRFVLAALTAQLAVGLVLYGLIAWTARLPLAALLRESRPALLLALTTTSSAAALPAAISGMERLGLRRELLGVVMPLGLSFNLAGSSIQLMMGVLFAAQAAGRDLSWPDLWLVWLVLKIAVKGVAGVPRANMVILSAVLPLFGLPIVVLPLLLAVDGIIDMLRTPVNVFGNCLAPCVLARFCPETPKADLAASHLTE